MRLTEPLVYFVADTQICTPSIEEVIAHDMYGLPEYLDEVGAPEFKSDAISAGEELVEVMGRMCYRSFKPGLNSNVEKVREGNFDYLQNIISVGHGSVLEHSSATFIFKDVSRVFCMELIRHRAGVAISQESLRYVRLDDLGFWVPLSAKEYDWLPAELIRIIENTEKEIKFLNEKIFNDPNFGIGLTQKQVFEKKKKFTSLIRRIAPIGLSTAIGWTANFRTLRHVIELRTSRHAEEEIRLVFGQVAEICRHRYPAVFSDFKTEMIDGYLEYTTEHGKV